MVSNALARCYTLEKLYLQQGASTEIQSQLEQSISRMYSAVLVYLVEAKKYYAQGTAGLFANTNIQRRGLITDLME